MTDLTLDNRGLRLTASVRGAADAVPVLFLHGVSMSRDTWLEVSDALGDRYQRWTLDFRGHGHSDRAPEYTLDGYRSDAETALAAIGRPTIVVGHSLGACVAGQLAQAAHPLVRAVFLEDPPWYLAGQFERSAFPGVFGVVAVQQGKWQAANAPLAEYLSFATHAPSPMGGKASDHFSPRHLLSHASALQRQDNRVWTNVASGARTGGGALAAIRTDQPFRVPAMVIACDPKLGAAMLDGHPQRLAATNPDASIVTYAGSGHNPRRSLAFGERYLGDLRSWLERVARPT